MIDYPTLYKLDSTGRLRTWRMQLDGSRYRTLSGLADGKQAESGWTQAVAKSQPTDEQQAVFEVNAQYKHQLDREYHDNPDSVTTPKMIEPMLAKTYGEWPGPGFMQAKLDGIRCIMTAAGMFSRQGQPIVAVPHLHAELAELFANNPDLILDGELYNHQLRADFGEISSIVRKKNPSVEDFEKAERVMQYHVYDIVDLDDPFSARSSTVRRLLAKYQDGIQIVDTRFVESREEADELYGEYVEAGYEGGMYRLDKPYELGKRSKALLKRKDFVTEEFRVKSIHEGVGNWAGAVKRFTLLNNDGSDGEFGAGVRGSYKLLQRWLNENEFQPTTNAVATVRYFMRSPDGVPRFPVVIDYHPNGRQD